MRPALLAEATGNQNGELGGGFARPLLWKRCPWGLGVEIRDNKSPHWAPAEASTASFGHSGASGCVAWFDPETRTAWSIHGTRTADTGWLIRRAPEVAAAILSHPSGFLAEAAGVGIQRDGQQQHGSGHHELDGGR